MRTIITAALAVILICANVAPAYAYPVDFLSFEAGFAAFFQFTGPTNLQSNLLRNLFRTIQTSKDDYLIGFIPADGLESDPRQDAKIFISNSGWVVAYYLSDCPVSKGIDYGFATKTRLEKALDKVAFAIDATGYQVGFTHFQHQQAQHLLRMGRKRPNQGYIGTDTFQFRLPGSNQYFERSWSISSSRYNQAILYLDGPVLGQGAGNAYGIIQPTGMVTDAKHIAGIRSYLNFMGDVFGELVILYNGENSFTIDYADFIKVIDLTPPPFGLIDAAMVLPIYPVFVPNLSR